jgi:hypothetical protein
MKKKLLKSQKLIIPAHAKLFTKNEKDFSLDRSLSFANKGPNYDMKYFITRATILSVYRESLKLCYQIKEDRDSRESMIDLMKDEFRPFRQARDRQKLLT